MALETDEQGLLNSRGRNVTIRMTAAIHMGLLCAVAAACAPTTVTGPATVNDGGAGESTAQSVQNVDETVVENAPSPLVYSWDTEFSAFLSPPIEIRRLAQDDCHAAGYEIAVVETMALVGSTATATFICRGDFE